MEPSRKHCTLTEDFVVAEVQQRDSVRRFFAMEREQVLTNDLSGFGLVKKRIGPYERLEMAGVPTKCSFGKIFSLFFWEKYFFIDCNADG
jgi:hypothetical protein